MKKLKVLVACEYSGIVRDAFSRKGHDAWSCDLLPTESELTIKEGKHIQDDAIEIAYGYQWDLMIAHPPCKHLSVAGASHWAKKQSDGRQQKAIEFFVKLFIAPINRICIENPPGIITKVLRKPNQYVEPYWFGHPFKKKTGLWLKNLPGLIPDNIVKPESYWSQPHGSAYKNKSMLLNSKGGHRTEKKRSLTFEGIAKAMADQWG